ncbi:hypothetical protein FOA52_001431 [Chlamydomonas sp. UWO 241]|nr:hypothetical protein FOA52_001431 [Chlamydomonas sp. UWO 241]
MDGEDNDDEDDGSEGSGEGWRSEGERGRSRSCSRSRGGRQRGGSSTSGSSSGSSGGSSSDSGFGGSGGGGGSAATGKKQAQGQKQRGKGGTRKPKAYKFVARPPRTWWPQTGTPPPEPPKPGAPAPDLFRPLELWELPGLLMAGGDDASPSALEGLMVEGGGVAGGAGGASGSGGGGGGGFPGVGAGGGVHGGEGGMPGEPTAERWLQLLELVQHMGIKLPAVDKEDRAKRQLEIEDLLRATADAAAKEERVRARAHRERAGPGRWSKVEVDESDGDENLDPTATWGKDLAEGYFPIGRLQAPAPAREPPDTPASAPAAGDLAAKAGGPRPDAPIWRAGIEACLFDPTSQRVVPLGRARTAAGAAARVDAAIVAILGTNSRSGAPTNARRAAATARAAMRAAAADCTEVLEAAIAVAAAEAVAVARAGRGADGAAASLGAGGGAFQVCPSTWGAPGLDGEAPAARRRQPAVPPQRGEALARTLAWLMHGPARLPGARELRMGMCSSGSEDGEGGGARGPLFGCGRCVVCRDPSGAGRECVRRRHRRAWRDADPELQHLARGRGAAHAPAAHALAAAAAPPGGSGALSLWAATPGGGSGAGADALPMWAASPGGGSNAGAGAGAGAFLAHTSGGVRGTGGVARSREGAAAAHLRALCIGRPAVVELFGMPGGGEGDAGSDSDHPQPQPPPATLTLMSGDASVVRSQLSDAPARAVTAARLAAAGVSGGMPGDGMTGGGVPWGCMPGEEGGGEHGEGGRDGPLTQVRMLSGAAARGDAPRPRGTSAPRAGGGACVWCRGRDHVTRDCPLWMLCALPPAPPPPLPLAELAHGHGAEGSARRLKRARKDKHKGHKSKRGRGGHAVGARAQARAHGVQAAAATAAAAAHEAQAAAVAQAEASLLVERPGGHALAAVPCWLSRLDHHTLDAVDHVQQAATWACARVQTAQDHLPGGPLTMTPAVALALAVLAQEAAAAEVDARDADRAVAEAEAQLEAEAQAEEDARTRAREWALMQVDVRQGGWVSDSLSGSLSDDSWGDEST